MTCEPFLVEEDPLAVPLSQPGSAFEGLLGREDPMMLEANLCLPAPSATINFYPDDGGDVPRSPEYVPGSKLWVDNHVQEEVVFGPGVQLEEEPAVLPPAEGACVELEISNLVHRMEIDSEGGEDLGPSPGLADDGVLGHDDADGRQGGKDLFRKLPGPLLPKPAPPAGDTPRPGRGRRTMASTRSSLRLAARPSPVPVAQRAQHKLMRELDFVNGQPPAPDAAVTAYVDMYADDLPEQAIVAIRAATKMGNKKLVKVLAAMTEQAAGAAMEVL